jgi:pimeloyl-ACP methyl ester carboxylesterase
MTEFVASADGLNIAFETVGAGAPVVLVHGFASDRVQNWKAPGWYKVLADAGYRVVAMDCRGHGESDKPHDAKFYGHEAMADDVLRVVRAADAHGGHLMGYSMGGMIAIELLVHHGGAFGKVVLGGVGSTYLAPSGSAEATMTSPAVRRRIAQALVEPDKSRISDPVALGFRKFAEQAGKDLKALAACMSAERRSYTREELSRMGKPVLVVCGENDDRTGAAEGLASAFPNGRGVTVPRRDHMTTVGDKVTKQAVAEFFAE